MEYEYQLPRKLPVNVYVLDTGVRIDHRQFDGRASIGWDFTDESNLHEVVDGHGTHVAGILGGKDVGVASDVNIISVKVLGERSGFEDIIRAMDWVADQAEATGEPSVMNMSFSFYRPLEPIDSAANSAVTRGVHVVVAAGNLNIDAKDTSPARAGSVMTVGATTILDTRWPFSNFGPCVGVFAPGVDILSAGIGSDEELVLNTGTSMAAPHVAGMMAYLLQMNGNVTPAEMIGEIWRRARILDRESAGIPQNTV